MNQPIREALPTPRGWLVEPTKDFCLFFIRDPKSVWFLRQFSLSFGMALKKEFQQQLKNKRQFDYESAHEALNELLSNDWRLIEYQINNASS